jgi:(p)ppGpp synthase/HD superfamily hydrolase
MNEGSIAADRAREIARAAHAGQVDKGGRPYFEHVERVAHRLQKLFPDADVTEVEAAWLHDTIEDCGYSTDRLIAEGVSPRAAEIVSKLSRDENLGYLEWIEQLAASGDVGVIRVKLADNLDNSDPARPDFPGRADMMAKRYEPARRLLEATLSSLQNN